MGTAWKDGLQAATYLVAIFAAALSWLQYRKNSARERTRWLFDLYERFYGQQTLRDMRIRLDTGRLEFLDSDDEVPAEFDDFLNFFEFIAFLQRRNEIKKEEVNTLFAYPLQSLGKHAKVISYLRRYDYGELDQLLKDLGYAS